MAEVSGGRVRGRPRLGWMDGMKVALGNTGMMVEAVRRDWEEWRALAHMQLNEFHVAIFAWHCVLFDHFLCSGDYHLERGVMPLHDAGEINCEKRTTTENQG